MDVIMNRKSSKWFYCDCCHAWCRTPRKPTWEDLHANSIATVANTCTFS